MREAREKNKSAPLYHNERLTFQILWALKLAEPIMVSLNSEKGMCRKEPLYC